MKLLFDIVHPAHVHFFKHMIRELESRGHGVKIVGRHKDVTCALLEHYGFDYVPVGRAGSKSLLGLGQELLARNIAIWRIARRFRPDAILTRNPAGAQVARLMGIPGIFDTDDGAAAGIHFKAAAPFAHVITTPDCFEESYGAKHLKYPGYKQSAYLHPKLFEPDRRALATLGVQPGERLFLVRFVAMAASHDAGESGLPMAVKEAVVERLRACGRLFLSSEGELPERWREHQVQLPPHLMHDVLAHCDLMVGDSQTMAAEAAVLGTPNLRISSWAGRLPHLEELERRYGLTRAFTPAQADAFLASLDELLDLDDARASRREGLDRLWREKCNLMRWFVDRLEADPPFGPIARARKT